MRIKPPGGPSPADVPHAPDGVATTAGNSFSRKLDPAAVPEAPESAQLKEVVDRFSKADLHDPQTADTMVRQVLGELIATDWSGTAGLSEADQRNLVDFMSSDPVI